MLFKAKCLIVILTLVKFAVSTQVDQCWLDKPESNLTERVDIESPLGKCEQQPCLVLRKNPFSLEYRFTPQKSFKQVRIFIESQYIRARGKSFDACPFIYRVADDKKGCPVDKDTLYTYNNKLDLIADPAKFDVEMILSLKSGNKEVITCFAVDLKIQKQRGGKVQDITSARTPCAVSEDSESPEYK